MIRRPAATSRLRMQRNPFQTFLLVLSLAASLPLLAGNPGSAALEEQLDPRVVVLWGICLLVGSAVALATEWLPGGYRMLLLNRTGLLLVGLAAATYSVVILLAAGDVNDVRYAAASQIAYSAACVVRAHQVTRVMRVLKHLEEQRP
jgi:hypothetical protein